MKMTGSGIRPEVVAEAVKVLTAVAELDGTTKIGDSIEQLPSIKVTRKETDFEITHS